MLYRQHVKGCERVSPLRAYPGLQTGRVCPHGIRRCNAKEAWQGAFASNRCASAPRGRSRRSEDSAVLAASTILRPRLIISTNSLDEWRKVFASSPTSWFADEAKCTLDPKILSEGNPRLDKTAD